MVLDKVTTAVGAVMVTTLLCSMEAAKAVTAAVGAEMMTKLVCRVDNLNV